MARLEDKRSFKAINFDDADEYLEEGDTRSMLNVRVGYSDSGDDGIITNVKGTTSLFSELSFSLPAGTNKCIGTCADDQNSRLIWLNYNSNNNHGIYCYNTDSNTIQTILAASILNFTDSIIHSIDILDGNLAWVDANRPRAINVDTALDGTLGTVTIEELINDAKVVPMFPPVCTTTATTGSDFIQSLKSFQFIYRYVFIDGEKGAWSTVSKLIPTAYRDNHINKITLDVSTSEIFTKPTLRNVIEYVEFASRELYTLSFNQFLRITTSDLVSTVGIVDYYDTESKTPLDTTETNISFYENPIKAGSVAFQNDRKFYADCTEGYDAFSLSPSLSMINVQVIPSSGGIPYLSDCSTHISDRYLKPDSEYGYSIEFHDKYGRKSGAIDLPDLVIKTQEQLSNDYKANVLQFGLNLSAVGSYPSWAEKFEIIRSDNKTVTYFVQGRVNTVLYCTGYDANGDPTYINATANVASPNISDTGAIEIHIDIGNWTQFGTNIGYSFTEGDRVTFFTMGGVLDSDGSSTLQGLKIKELRGSLLIVDYPEIGRVNLNHAMIASTQYASGVGANLNGVLSRFIVGDNGVILYSRIDRIIIENPPGTFSPLAFPFPYTGIAAPDFLPTITNHLYGVSLNYAGSIGTSIDIFVVGAEGFFIRGNYNADTNVFGTWNTANTGVSTDLNCVESSFLYHDRSNLIIVGNAGVILRYDISTGVFTRLISGTTENLNYVYRNQGTDVLVAVGDNGTILRTTNNGDSWTQLEIDNCQNLNGVFINGTVAATVGDEGLLLYSTNSGVTWIQKGIGTVSNLNSCEGQQNVSDCVYVAGDNGYLSLFQMSTGNLLNGYSTETTKNINFFQSYSIPSTADLGILVGDFDLLMDTNNNTTPAIFTSYSSNVSSIYGTTYLNYRAKIEVYSPKTVSGPVIYYETGDAYPVGANYTFNKGKESDGDVFLIRKDFRGDDWAMSGDLVFSMTPNSLDTGGTWDKDLGRPNTVLLYPEKQQRRNIIRYSQKYVQDSRINGLSNFLEANYESIPNEFGFVRKISPIESVLLINAERESATAYIDQTVFRGTDGQDVAATSDRVINNVRKLTGGFGCINPESVVSYLGTVYFFSSNKSSVCRYNNSNGIFPISEYKARTYFYELNGFINTEETYIGGYDPKFRNYLLTAILASQGPESELNSNFVKDYSVTTVSTPDSTSPVQFTVAQVPIGNIYMGSSGDNPVSVIDRETNTLVTSIDVGTDPATISQNIVYANESIYVCGATSIVCINPDTNTVVATITVGSNNFMIAFCDTNNSLYVSDANDNNIHVIDTDTNTHTTDIALPSSGDPFHIEYISDVDKVYCVDPNASPTANLYCIDPDTNTLFATVALPVDAKKMTYCPDNRRLYIASTVAGSVTSVSVDTNTVVNIISVASSLFWPAYGNGFVYVPSMTTNRVYFIDITTDTVVGSVLCGSGVRFCAFNPSDNNIYCSNSGTNTVSIISTDTNTVIETLTVGSTPQYPVMGELSKTYITNNGSSSISILSTVWDFSETIAFQEGSNRWISKYSFIPERYGYVNVDMFSFKNGVLWKHNASSTYNNFYGAQYTSKVNPVFNKAPVSQKNFTYMSLDADKVWTVNPITTPEGQETFILSAHFEKIQNEWFADIKQDINTPNMASESEALFNGDFMQSNTLNVLLESQASGITKLKFVNVYSNIINNGFSQ